MIRLDKGMVLANLTNLATLFKSYVDGRVSALATTVSEIMEEANSSIISLEREKADNKTMTGATASENGGSGLVPAPLSEDREKFLCGDGVWKTPPAVDGDSIDDETINAFAAANIDISE